MILTRKEKGEITVEKVSTRDAEKTIHDRKRPMTHLCWEGNCPLELCNAKTCPKVCDVDKKSIEDYDFIISGLEGYKESGELSFLVVQECALYNRYLNEHPEEKAKVKVK